MNNTFSLEQMAKVGDLNFDLPMRQKNWIKQLNIWK